METIRSKFVIGMIAILVLSSSCVSEEGPFLTEIEPIEEVSYSADIQPIFTNRCIQCHDESHPTGLNLQEGVSFDLLVNVVSTNYNPALRIEPFSIENSVLWHKIIGDDVYGGMMPPVGDPVSNLELEEIKAWIEAGAPNN